MTILNEDRLFPSDPNTRSVARRLYGGVRDLSIISPHGHADPRWFAEDEPFSDPANLFVVPDHYIYRMLYSQGASLEQLGVGSTALEDPQTHLANFRAALLSFPRDTDKTVAGFRFPGALWFGCASHC